MNGCCMYEFSDLDNPVVVPKLIPFEAFEDAQAAVERLIEIYQRNTAFIRKAFADFLAGQFPEGQKARACYPAIRLRVSTYQEVDTRLSYGHAIEPGVYMATVTQPDLFADYLREQISLLLDNHGVPIEIGESDMPIPLHFAFMEGEYIDTGDNQAEGVALRDHFDVPNLAVTDDAIVNGTWVQRRGEPLPLAPFTAPRVDYSLHRLKHYTATSPQYFQNFILFTNYQFYIDEFVQWARTTLEREEGGYTALVEPGDVITYRGMGAQAQGERPDRLPQMPSYHLLRDDKAALTLINIGVGPSNAKTDRKNTRLKSSHVAIS